MTYEETLAYIYARVPSFQAVGASAYKPGLDRMRQMMAHIGNPHKLLKTIHIAGTNGKGSTAHSLAAVLQAAGFHVGLYTSPHLVDFRERIRIDGQMPSREFVVDFVEKFDIERFEPTFFELTTAMAFAFFAMKQVDVAVIETGLGGRLDSTNIITPLLSVITNIGLDHTALLGDTLPQIAAEKAGIIKSHVPVVVGEAPQAEVRAVFEAKAAAEHAPLTYATPLESQYMDHTRMLYYPQTPYGPVECDLVGPSQPKNMATVMAALQQLELHGVPITAHAVATGLRQVQALTGLMGRWMWLMGADIPTLVDTGHNAHGWQYNAPALASLPRPLAVVIGFVDDKDVDDILAMLPQAPDIHYILTQPTTHRALPVAALAQAATAAGLTFAVSDSVEQGYRQAKALNPATIFVGGSTYVVADLMSGMQ